MQYNLAWSFCQSRAVGDWQPFTGFHPNAVWTLKFKQNQLGISIEMLRIFQTYENNTRKYLHGGLFGQIMAVQTSWAKHSVNTIENQGSFLPKSKGGGGGQNFLDKIPRGPYVNLPSPPPHTLCASMPVFLKPGVAKILRCAHLNFY
jgi:hypothetical protein